jgi:hypothetical protein
MPSDLSLLGRFGRKKRAEADDGEGAERETNVTFEQDEDIAAQLEANVLPGEGYTKVNVGRSDEATTLLITQQSQDAQ